MDRSKFGHRVLRGKVVMRCLLNSLPQVTCVLLWTLFASSLWATVLSLRVGWEKSQLKAEVWYAMWRGSLLWTQARYSNDLIHLLQPSLLPWAEGQTRPEQNDETVLSEWSTTEAAAAAMFFCDIVFVVCNDRAERCFFPVTVCTRKTTELPDMTDVYVSLTSGLFRLMSSRGRSCLALL